MLWPKNRGFLTANFLQLPILVSQLTSLFPLTFDHVRSRRTNKNCIRFSWTGLGFISLVVRLIIGIISGTFLSHKSDALARLFGEWSSTASFAQFIANFSIGISDLAWSVLLICKHEDLNKFYTKLAQLVNNLLDHASSFDKYGIIHETIMRKYITIRRAIFYVMLVPIPPILITSIIYIPRAKVLFGGNWLDWNVLALPVLLLHWSFTLHFRLLSYYLLIAFIFIFEVGFRILKLKIKAGIQSEKYPQTINERDHMWAHSWFSKDLLALHASIGTKSKATTWIIENFDALRDLLKEFHKVFKLFLVSTCVTIFMSLLEASFQALLITMGNSNAGDGGINWYQLFTVWPHIVTCMLTFYMLCDSATSMTNEVRCPTKICVSFCKLYA